jgi:AcrR family transcriptional regulator
MPKVTEAHRVARREQILAAAFRCVAREGFHKTTMADVIVESGMSAGAVYGYFKGKHEIIRAIADHAVGGLSVSLGELAGGEGPVAPVDALALVLEHVEHLAGSEDGDLTRVAVQAWAEACRDEEVREIARHRLLAVRAGWEAVLVRAQQDGTLDPDADTALVAQTMLGLLPGFVLQRLIIGDVTAASYVAGFRGVTG